MEILILLKSNLLILTVIKKVKDKIFLVINFKNPNRLRILHPCLRLN